MDIPVGRPEPISNVAARTAEDAAPAALPVTEIPWTRIDLDLYEVARDGRIVGYIEVVGAVFVALGGTRYDRAVEVAQHLTFHAAVDTVLRHAGRETRSAM
ncbi:hypothetical protein [Microbacterium sp. 5K110]|uniref:hypothetical protein n=2 Tax=unclassified Microbacterium TaxID=2609290 RepID=UPI0012842A07|nr:hypothetical protein [Microbacterium sp. 5K110]TLF32240.1 hypothetical protein FE256_06055 [Microbacterium sp. 5K110]